MFTCYVRLNLYSGSDPLDVRFSRSTDGGVSWSPSIKINDDIGTNAYQWFGTMSVAPNGRIDVVWLDTRDNPGNLPIIFVLFLLDRCGRNLVGEREDV